MDYDKFRQLLDAYSDADVGLERIDAREDILNFLDPLINDADRYQFLRSQPNDTSAPRLDVVYWTVADETCNDGEGVRGEELDRLIDIERGHNLAPKSCDSLVKQM